MTGVGRTRVRLVSCRDWMEIAASLMYNHVSIQLKICQRVTRNGGYFLRKRDGRRISVSRESRRADTQAAGRSDQPVSIGREEFE